MPVQIYNMTPHKIVLFGEDNEVLKEFPSSGTIRLETLKQKVEVDPISKIVPTYTVERSKGSFVPPVEENVYYIVSSLVQDAYPERKDFIAPNTSADAVGAVRNSVGELLGVRSFILNK